MKTNFEYCGIQIEITYNDNGYLEFVKNITTNEYLMIESKISGTGFTIDEDDSMFGKLNICKSTYARIMDLDIFIPRMIFIVNNK